MSLGESRFQVHVYVHLFLVRQLDLDLEGSGLRV